MLLKSPFKALLLFVVLASAKCLADQSPNFYHTNSTKEIEAMIGSATRNHSAVVYFYRSNSVVAKDHLKIVEKAASNAVLWSNKVKFYALDCLIRVPKETNVSLTEDDQHKVDFCKNLKLDRLPFVLKYYKSNEKTVDVGKKFRLYNDPLILLEKAVYQTLSESPLNDAPSFHEFSRRVTSLEHLWQFMSNKCIGRLILVPIDTPDELSGQVRLILAAIATNGTIPIWPLLKDHPLIGAAQNVAYDQWDLIIVDRKTDIPTRGDWGHPNILGKKESFKLLDKIPIDPEGLELTKGNCDRLPIERASISFVDDMNKFDDNLAKKFNMNYFSKKIDKKTHEKYDFNLIYINHIYFK
ncbi:hypothetical protein M3Y97_00746100 [Aphelenchoides bicaudatus]|nr:hypothetical protein M3Y97_00746100 [Aphelenchoides bicaudatus]